MSVFKNLLRRERDRQLGRVERICFPHVPKCAGSSLTGAIYRHYGSQLKLLSRSMTIDLKASRRAADARGVSIYDVRQSVLAYTLASENYFLASGHVPCKPDVVQAFSDRWRFITVLRDPVERWISSYVYNRYKTADWARVDLPVEEYLQSEQGRSEGMIYLNYFSQMASPPAPGEHQRYVDQAETNLRRFALVGDSGRFAEFEQDFATAFGRTLSIPKANPSPAPEAKREIKSNPALMEQINQVCQPDRELYQRFFP